MFLHLRLTAIALLLQLQSIHFLQGLKVVCQDMFFSRSKSNATAQGLLSHSANSAGGRKALESAFSIAGPKDDRSVIASELLEVKVTEPTEAEFSGEVGIFLKFFFGTPCSSHC